MKHARARDLLAALPDGSLPLTTEAAVRAHAADCTECRRGIDELELSETLLRALPRRFLPLEWGPEADRRLVALASWVGGPLPAPPQHSPAQALGSLAAACILAVLLCTASLLPHLGGGGEASMALARLSVADMSLLPGAPR